MFVWLDEKEVPVAQGCNAVSMRARYRQHYVHLLCVAQLVAEGRWKRHLFPARYSPKLYTSLDSPEHSDLGAGSSDAEGCSDTDSDKDNAFETGGDPV